MIRRFGSETALVLIDVQRGVDELTHWGGQSGRRNNPGAEGRIALLLTAWREHGLTVLFTRHDSREAASPLRSDHVGYGFKAGREPLAGEAVFGKRANSGYVGTKLEVALRDSGIHRVVHVGFFTNMCVETTVRMSGNLGFDSYLVEEACSCTNRVGPDGTDYDPEVVHALSVASLHGEFCTNITIADALALLGGDVERLDRVQGNE